MKNKYIGIIAIIVIAILASVGYFYFDKQSTEKKYRPVRTENPPLVDFEITRTKLLEESKVTFPKVTKEQTISQADLPFDLHSLINPEQRNLSIKQLEFENKIGYEIQYDLTKILYQAEYYFDGLIAKKMFKFVSFWGSPMVSVWKLENSDYSVVIQPYVTDAQNISVLITAIKN